MQNINAFDHAETILKFWRRVLFLLLPQAADTIR